MIAGQAQGVETGRLPQVRSIDDLEGLAVGVQRGEAGEPVGQRLVAEGRAAQVRVYDDDHVEAAVRGLGAGDCDAVLKLAPVLSELVKPLPGVEVVQRGLSVEDIAIAVAPADQAPAGRLRVAQAELEEDGTLQRSRCKRLGNSVGELHLGSV